MSKLGDILKEEKHGDDATKRINMEIRSRRPSWKDVETILEELAPSKMNEVRTMMKQEAPYLFKGEKDVPNVKVNVSEGKPIKPVGMVEPTTEDPSSGDPKTSGKDKASEASDQQTDPGFSGSSQLRDDLLQAQKEAERALEGGGMA